MIHELFFDFQFFFQTPSEVFIQLIRQVIKVMLQEETVLEQRFLVHVGVQVNILVGPRITRFLDQKFYRAM